MEQSTSGPASLDTVYGYICTAPAPALNDMPAAPDLCRAMLCISAAYAVPSCSVCLSVTFVHTVETNKHVFKIFHLWVATPL